VRKRGRRRVIDVTVEDGGGGLNFPQNDRGDSVFGS